MDEINKKAKQISYYIYEECCRYNLTEWCEDRYFTVADFEAFIRAGEKHFAEEVSDE